MKKKRVFLIVLDSVGVGALPDAADFGDEGANTLRRIASSPSFSASNLVALGLGNIPGVDYLPRADRPLAAYGKAAERSRGKDTTVGHWEIAGVISGRSRSGGTGSDFVRMRTRRFTSSSRKGSVPVRRW